MSEITRLGCEVCGSHHDCECNQLIDCARCGSAFIQRDENDFVCDECVEDLTVDDLVES
jgi:hypothetical protein